MTHGCYNSIIIFGQDKQSEFEDQTIEEQNLQGSTGITEQLTCRLSGIHLPTGLGQILSQLHVLVSLTTCDRPHVTAQCQHGRYKAHQMIHLVLDSLPAVPHEVLACEPACFAMPVVPCCSKAFGISSLIYK